MPLPSVPKGYACAGEHDRENQGLVLFTLFSDRLAPPTYSRYMLGLIRPANH
jgi:hypothetical protein